MRKIARKLYRAIPFKQPAYETLRRFLAVPEPIYRHLHFQGVIDVAEEQSDLSRAELEKLLDPKTLTRP